MNRILTARRELRETEQAVAEIEQKYYWLGGRGTGWKPEHYGIPHAEWDAAQDRHFALRDKARTLRNELRRMEGLARPTGRAISGPAHGGRR